jgi:hypothetical protein
MTLHALPLCDFECKTFEERACGETRFRRKLRNSVASCSGLRVAEKAQIQLHDGNLSAATGMEDTRASERRLQRVLGIIVCQAVRFDLHESLRIDRALDLYERARFRRAWLCTRRSASAC